MADRIFLIPTQQEKDMIFPLKRYRIKLLDYITNKKRYQGEMCTRSLQQQTRVRITSQFLRGSVPIEILTILSFLDLSVLI